VRSHALPASFCISTFRCIYSYYCVSHTVHVRTWLRPDHVRTAARLESVFIIFVVLPFVSHTVHVRTKQVRPRADCCTPAACPNLYTSLVGLHFVRSSRANGVAIPFLLYSSWLKNVPCWFVRSSRANGVDILIIYTYSTKFTCERGWYFISLFIPIAQSSRASGVDILFIKYRDDTFVRGGTCWDMYHFLALADRHVSTLMLLSSYHRITTE
jgi:hypothetical protein